MSIVNQFGKVLGKELKSLARSQVRSVVKKKTGNFLSHLFSKSHEDIQAEIKERLGFNTTHYKVKNNEIEFNSNPVFISEWLMKSPNLQPLVRDEETGKVYYDGKLLDNSSKLYLIDQFIQNTGTKSNTVHSHLENALKLLPVSDYTAAKFKQKFDGWDPKETSVIDNWMTNCFGDFGENTKYYNSLFRKWIIGTARRIIEPGSSLDGMLCLTGPSGAGKTRHFRLLLEERAGEIYCENIKNPRKLLESIIGKSVACFDELAVLQNGSDVEETWKQLLSLQEVTVRLAYRRDAQSYKLRCGFCGTTNESKFIKDPALSRRMWVVELQTDQHLNFDFLESSRDDLWREALFYAKKGETCFLTPTEQKLVEEYNKKYLM